MEYDFRSIEQKRQEKWKADKVYEVSNNSDKPKYYVLDMFPYPSGAGLHVGHPLGYIASDIFSRYKRLKGFNVLHPMGFDSFGLPAEQYALETGQHPADTTEKNIATFKSQLDKIGFCYDWSREIRTSDATYYKWTQWIFLQLFNSYFCNTQQKARPIGDLIKKYETKGSKHFTAGEWNAYSKKEQADILMQRRLAFSSFGEVNWCEALGTVLANDEVVNGVSERGGHPVVKKKMRQWYLRITAYADRLLQGLETVNFSDAMKEMQRNWIGKSEGAEMIFPLIPNPSPRGEKGTAETGAKGAALVPKYSVSSPMQFELAKENRKGHTEAENKLWQELRNNQLDAKFRRQHPIDAYIVDFVCLQQALIIEVDGGYHETKDQKDYDDVRTNTLNEIGFTVLRFTNQQVLTNTAEVIEKIKTAINSSETHDNKKDTGTNEFSHPSPPGEQGPGVRVYTTRPDTIFGVDFLVLAPEHELVQQITTPDQKEKIDEYLTYVKSRSDRERMAEVKQITGCFTGAYAANPFDGKQIPIWIAEYVLAGYGTGAIMAVPCGDQRDFAFAKHFNIPITNIIGAHYNGEEANPTKDAVLENSGFLNGLLMKDAIGVAIDKIEALGIGKRKKNYRMRDAGFSRQRYWGEPFPIKWEDGIAVALDESELPLKLPHVDKYGPGPEGEGPLANIGEWVNIAKASVDLAVASVDLTPNPSPKERGTQDPAPYGYINSTIEEWKKTVAFAKQNRQESTPEEEIIWQELRNRQVDGYKFRRQHPVAGYIPDFICLEKQLIIEIDGGYHNDEEQQIFDSGRQAWLKENGFEMLRFTNGEVKNNLQAVLKKISEELFKERKTEDRAGSGSPLPGRGVGGEVKRETSTMPGYAGSSWYFLRYMDPNNDSTFCDRKISDYWNQVDLYIGGTEHAVGHLLYSRMWTKVLYDLGLIGFDEPFKQLLNQGMITGVSQFNYRGEADVIYKMIVGSNLTVINDFQPRSFGDRVMNHFISSDIVSLPDNLNKIHVPVKHVDSNGNTNKLDLGSYYNESLLDKNSVFYTKGGYFVDGSWYDYKHNPIEKKDFFTISEVEKMSKSKLNTHNPDDLVFKYGADTFRMYEMFLGPVEQSKPWDTKGIEGVHRFLRKLWRLFYDEVKGKIWSDEKATDAELKVLHRTIKKIEEDTERFSFNTAVSTFMICVNELADLKCHKKEVLEKLLIILTPYAPHIAEELWSGLGNEGSILDASFPSVEEKYLVETAKEYPVSINGKVRTQLSMPLDIDQPEVEQRILANETVQKWLEGKAPKKIIYVKGKMVNVVV